MRDTSSTDTGSSANAPRRAFKQRVHYGSDSSVFHATRCLTKTEREEVDAMIDIMDTAGSSEKRQAAAKTLGSMPVKLVETKREYRIDHSKHYPNAGAFTKAAQKLRNARRLAATLA